MATKTFKIGLSATDKQNMAQDIYERLLDLTFAEYDSSKTYNTGDFVVHSDVLYKCLEDNVTGTWNSSKWQTATLQDLLDDVEDAVSQVNDKANVDGNYPTMTVGLADNLTPYGEDSGTEQTNPFISNGTGTNNNTEIVTVGDYGLLKEKQGNTVVVNQQVVNGNFESSSGWISNNSTFNVSNNVATFTATAQNGGFYRTGIPRISGHTYLVMATIKTTTATTEINLTFADDVLSSSIATTNKQTLFAIQTYNTSAGSGVSITDARSSGWDDINVYGIHIVDLTQMFNGDIPTDLLANPSHFSWYYNGDLSYNTGTLVNANGVKLVSTGRQQWDEETKLGYYASSNGNYTSANDQLCSVNPIRVIPNATYYIKKGSLTDLRFYDGNMNYISGNQQGSNSTFVVPSNACFLHINLRSAYGTTYNNDITISLYYTPKQGGEGYDKYYPYETPYEVDTGSEVLRSAGSVYDYKEPNGTIHRVVGSYTFTGSENWSKSNHAYYANITAVSSIIKGVPTNTVANIICDVLVAKKADRLYTYGDTETGIATAPNGTIWIAELSYQSISSLTGKTIYFELAEETPEQGTSFSENLPINDYGMLYWDNINGIPQGNTIFFPVNYKGFVDDMYSRVDGDSSQYAIQSELLPQKDTTRLTQTLVLTGANSEDWSTSGSYSNVKRFNLAGTFARYLDTEHPRGIGTATSDGLTINWIQDSSFSSITNLSACFISGTGATASQLILLIPNSESVSTVEQLRNWLSTHNITVEYEYSKYKLVATLLNGVVTYNWEKD